MLHPKLIAFNLDNSMLKTLPTPLDLLDELDAEGTPNTERVRLAGIPLSKQRIGQLESLLEIFGAKDLARAVEQALAREEDPIIAETLKGFKFSHLVGLGVTDPSDLNRFVDFLRSKQRFAGLAQVSADNPEPQVIFGHAKPRNPKHQARCIIRYEDGQIIERIEVWNLHITLYKELIPEATRAHYEGYWERHPGWEKNPALWQRTWSEAELGTLLGKVKPDSRPKFPIGIDEMDALVDRLFGESFTDATLRSRNPDLSLRKVESGFNRINLLELGIPEADICQIIEFLLSDQMKTALNEQDYNPIPVTLDESEIDVEFKIYEDRFWDDEDGNDQLTMGIRLDTTDGKPLWQLRGTVHRLIEG
ncbi:MAG: hypothetical protein HQ596_04930 [Candidatus Saganbacteria bacterium]|nr:hypothetical protein [Candidatus Saganbacteria bacterium]